eukprot:COSAG01_NODE_1855_length_9052_cov_4.358883_9_plen_100_part_00
MDIGRRLGAITASCDTLVVLGCHTPEYKTAYDTRVRSRLTLTTDVPSVITPQALAEKGGQEEAEPKTEDVEDVEDDSDDADEDSSEDDSDDSDDSDESN